MREMKFSGIEWIGNIPEDWSVRKIKQLFTVISGATPKSANSEYWDGDIVWITPADYKTDDIYVSCGHKNITKAGLESCATRLVPVNSIIFSKRAPVGAIAINTQELCTNQGCMSCIPNENTNVKFYFYIMSICQKEFEELSSGTTFKELSTEVFGDFKLPYVVQYVQDKIVKYLDKKCSEIDDVIKGKEEENQLLEEYRKSIIYEAVTKGLNPNVEMKDSGIEWIGNIPEDWGIIRLNNVFLMHSGGIWGDEEGKADVDIKCVRVADFDYEHLSVNMHEHMTKRSYANKAFQNNVLRKGDILLEKSGGGEQTPVGRAVIYDSVDKMTCANFIEYLRVNNANSPKYIVYLLSSFYQTGESKKYIKQTTGIQNLDVSAWLSTKICIPSRMEQQQISDYLDKKCEEIDNLIKGNNDLIAHLKEYKKSLIYEAVTGKIEI